MKMDGYGVIGLRAWLCALSVLLVFATSSNAFYLPGSYMRKFAQNDNLSVMVNSLTSIDTELPFSYYSLPYCKPPGGEKHSPENLGELLMGDRIENSPYQFHMNVNESSVFLCTTTKLNSDMVKMLKHRINDRYQVNTMLDSLPAIRYIKIGDVLVPWTGFLVGLSGENQYCISNHLKFTVLIHEYEDSGTVIGTGDGLDVIATGGDGNSTSAFQVVGFEVIPCSIRHSDKDALSKLHMYDKISPPIEDCKEYAQMCFQEGDQITFSYDVTFVKSDIRWPSRWDAYLKMEGARVHWFSILNSLMVITFLAGIVFVIFLRTVRRDLTKYEDLDKEAQAQMTEELSGWKLVVGDVFRAPPHAKLLSVMVGNGVQITGMALVTILFAALGFMSPAARGMLLTGMILLYLFLGIFAGYVAVRLWRTIKGDTTGWRSIAWRVACFYPGIAFGILMILNFIVWHSKSTGAIPISLFFLLIALWFCISVPLTLLGGYFGAKAEHIQIPVRVNQIPREIPKQKYPSWLMVVGAGMLPFGTLFIELFFIMSSIWLGRVYYVFGFLLVVLVLLVVVCSEVSVVLTYMHLCVEDWRWWWKSFFASGSVSLYVFLYAINYLVFDLQSLSGSASTALFLGYSILMAFSIMLATGTIGFLMSFWFVHYLFSSVKID